MKTLRILSLATVLSIGVAGAGFAAASDSAGAPQSGVGATAGNVPSGTTTTVPTTPNTSQYGMTGAAPYASGQPSSGTPVGPTGSMKRDATNPLGMGKGGGDNGNGGNGGGGNAGR